MGVCGEELQQRSCCRHCDLVRQRPRRVAEELCRHLLTRLAPRRIDRRRPRKRAHVQPVPAVVVAAVARLPHLHVIGAVSRCEHAHHAVLKGDRHIVDGSQFEPLFIEDRHGRIEQKCSQTERLHVDAESLSLRERNGEVIDVLTRHDALNCRVERHSLCFRQRAVGLLLVDDRQRAHEERSELGDARCAPHLHEMLAERTVLRHEDRGLERIVIDCLDATHNKRGGRVGRVEEQLRCVLEPDASKDEFAIPTPLHPSRQDQAQLWK